ncbi:hypothetical protein [Cognatiluteimonas profundi]|uniref:hypothetical protein n=1 Tax=Cognatiluteimonas profundi TaxID=2594501 RepID=UPI00131C1450|nr:hypothetical protein [Lysobacter profundi]
MPLYHATLREYSAGQIVQATERSSFYPEALSALEVTRSQDVPSRSICLFAADNIEFSYLFALRQQWAKEKINIYEVDMDSSRKAPMAIVHALQRKIEKGLPTEKLTSEYWSPAQSWNFMEFFGPSMVVLRQMAIPSINEFALSARYHLEADRASQL